MAEAKPSAGAKPRTLKDLFNLNNCKVTAFLAGTHYYIEVRDEWGNTVAEMPKSKAWIAEWNPDRDA